MRCKSYLLPHYVCIHDVAHSPPLQEENSCVMCKHIKDFSDMCQNSCGHIYCLSCLRGLSLVSPRPYTPVHSVSAG